MAETYGVFDYRALPLPLVATLAAGLREDSRVRMKHSNTIITSNSMLMIAIIDRLNWLIWSKTKDAQKGRNRPKPIMDSFFSKESQIRTYASGKDFEDARKKMLEQIIKEG